MFQNIDYGSHEWSITVRWLPGQRLNEDSGLGKEKEDRARAKGLGEVCVGQKMKVILGDAIELKTTTTKKQ